MTTLWSAGLKIAPSVRRASFHRLYSSRCFPMGSLEPSGYAANTRRSMRSASTSFVHRYISRAIWRIETPGATSALPSARSTLAKLASVGSPSGSGTITQTSSTLNVSPPLVRTCLYSSSIRAAPAPYMRAELICADILTPISGGRSVLKVTSHMPSNCDSF